MKIAHWADLEDEVERRLKRLMTHFELMYLRLYDTKSAGNYLPAQPSDFVIWVPGRPSIFLEAKYSGVAESLRSVFANAVSDQQMASARLAERAGQRYAVLFYSAPAAMFELWNGAYCSDRRSLGKPLELPQRIVSASLDEILQVHVLGLDEEKVRRVEAKARAGREAKA
jgi:hypothetical protein